MIRTVGLLAGAATLSASGFAGATDIESASVDALRAELSELRTQNENLASRLDAQDNAWLNETRATEIRGIVQDVLADSQSRTSLQDSGAMAGYKAGRGFFLSSQNGSFTMNITGQLQTRWVMSHVGDDLVGQDSANNNEWGFQVRRAKVRFQGNVIDKTWHYAINGSFVGNDGQAGAFNFQEATIGHDVNDNVTVSFGQFKTPFTREELVSSENQLAVERSLVNQYFNANRMVGVNLEYSTDAWRLNAAYGNGFRSAYNAPAYENTSSANNPTKWSGAARFDYKLSGDWADFDSFTSSPDAEEAMMFGVAVQAQNWNGLVGQGLAPIGGLPGPAITDSISMMGLTADFSMKMAGMSIYGAVVYQNYRSNNDNIDNVNPWGFVGQVGYSMTEQWEVFGRLSYANNRGLSSPGVTVDDSPDAKLMILTVGANYFINSNVKFTADFGYNLEDTLSGSWISDGQAASGWRATQESGEYVVRAQLQLLF